MPNNLGERLVYEEMRLRITTFASILCASSAALANLPNPDTRFRSGANHHVGDDSFVAKAERNAVDGVDGEKLRMKTHLVHVRALLASREATKPELAGRRAELLGYLDDYIANGITPVNVHLPWRSPVFIDDAGAICAVGYLIERSSGRALPERISKEHRFEVLEDISVAMPEVRDWISASGFTLEELASIQPAYSSPNIETWRTWDLVRHAPKDGAYEQKMASFGEPRRLSGAFHRKALHGAWTVKDDETGAVIGSGTLDHGSGMWKSFYNDGKRVLATGTYRNNKAHGAWTFFHPSGNPAAKGQMANGMRTGAWSFFYDTPKPTPIARGTFAASGAVTGVWQHFDGDGKLLARTYSRGGEVVDITADQRGVTEVVHAFQNPTNPVDALDHRLERFAFGGEKIFVQHSGYAKDEMVFDANGHRLAKTADGWTAADCHWPAKRKAIAKTDDVAWLHKILHRESHQRSKQDGEFGVQLTVETGPTCGDAKPVAADRAARLETILASRQAIRAPTPDFVKRMLVGQLETEVEPEPKKDDEDVTPDEEGVTHPAYLQRDDDHWTKDLRSLLATRTIAYVEWTHIDGRFARVFRTLAGHYSWEWHSSEDEADGSSPLENDRR
ncbi:MAG: hypothetical protein H0V17_15170 [Deltaproteobacteria bacterium]|nr:hypothetical protein [Deltaproteobacteria bacterium]